MTQKQTPVASVRLERELPAPPHEVYRAWLDPDLLRRWMAPACFVAKRAEVEERVGGRFRIWHADAGSDVGGFECEIVELVPDERIVFRWGFAGPEREAGPVFDSRLIITLRPAKREGTVLTLVHERLEEIAAAMPQIVEQVEVGWEQALEKLVGLLATGERVAGASNPKA